MDTATIVNIVLWVLGIIVSLTAAGLGVVFRMFLADRKETNDRLTAIELSRASEKGAAEALAKQATENAARQLDSNNASMRNMLERMTVMVKNSVGNDGP